ncbi:MAG: hypothetical protein JO246_08925 [Frankiaceae bacterium]|nr:hypothetical protein [Frankiaceae bacterium]
MARRRSRYAALVGLALTGVVLPPAQAVQASHSFVPGQATAIAQAVQLTPSTGGLAASISVGTTIAQYRSTLAQASSQRLNLGVIGSTLTVACDSSPPAARPDQLPQPLVAESDKGNSHASESTAGSGKNSGLSAVAGRETVRAWTRPRSMAKFDGNAVVVPGMLAISGLHTQSASQLIPHTARVATALAKIGEVKLLKGAIVLSGLKWTATQRSGKGSKLSGHFSIQAVKVAGKQLPVSAPKLTSTLNTVNKALTATGLHVSLPVKTVSHGKLTLSPLAVGIDKSKVGNDVLNPILTAVQPVTNAVLTTLVGISCKIGSLLGAVDLIQSGFDGTGGLDLNLGGVTATSDGKTYGNPFGNKPPPTLGNQGGHHPQGTNSGGSRGGTTTTTTSGGTSTGSGSGATSGTSSPTGQGSSSTASSLSSSCSTTSPANRPSCSRGSGLKVGLIALALLLAFAATDAVVLRVRRGAEPTS